MMRTFDQKKIEKPIQLKIEKNSLNVSFECLDLFKCGEKRGIWFSTLMQQKLFKTFSLRGPTTFGSLVWRSHAAQRSYFTEEFFKLKQIMLTCFDFAIGLIAICFKLGLELTRGINIIGA